MATKKQLRKRKPGRPIKGIPPIPDTFENILKALVRPIKKDRSEGQ